MQQFSTDAKALQEANAALGLLEQIEELNANLTAFSLTLNENQTAELSIYIKKLAALSSLLDDETNTPSLLSTNLLSKGLNKIERLGLGGEVIRLREVNKLQASEIASQLSLGVDTVRRFLKFYDNCKPSEKTKYQRTSIFNTAQQLEDLNVIIYKLLARTELVDAENFTRGISELRQTIKLAADVLEKSAAKNKEADFRRIMTEILCKELPHRQQEILQKFATIGINPVLESAFNPPVHKLKQIEMEEE